MQFCKDCGGALQLFGNSKNDLCSSCIQKQKKAVPENAAASAQNNDLLDQAVLTFENGRIVLRSKEGWELWSGNADAQNNFKMVLDRARRIYEIRLRRQKN